MDIQEWKTKNNKSRRYTHFDEKVSLDRIWDYISDKNKIKRHGFYPFIHYTLSYVKYNKKEGTKEKKREICYSAHIDRFIYQYYGFKINRVYNERLREDNIDEAVIAYRDNLHKNNIHFAKQAIDFIRSSDHCYIMIGDFSNFFDKLDHVYLKKMLCDLLKVEELPPDYYAVYKNITRYSTWDLRDLLDLNGMPLNEKGIREFNNLNVALPLQHFKKYKRQYVKPHKELYGIPQGSAISAVLSNVYMLEFDKKISDFVKQNNGLYMRYSDDFIIVIPEVSCDKYKDKLTFIHTVIKSIPHLDLQPDKTQLYQYSNKEITSCNEDFLINVKNRSNSIDYLGFAFNGREVRLRDKTVSKYYYRMYRKLKTIVKNNGYTKNRRRISCKNIYLKYSIKGANIGKGNFISYVKRAEQIFVDERAIVLVSNRHMQKIRKRLKKINV